MYPLIGKNFSNKAQSKLFIIYYLYFYIYNLKRLSNA